MAQKWKGSDADWIGLQRNWIKTCAPHMTTKRAYGSGLLNGGGWPVNKDPLNWLNAS